MWANAQRDGRPAKYRWYLLFNAAVWLMPTKYWEMVLKVKTKHHRNATLFSQTLSIIIYQCYVRVCIEHPCPQAVLANSIAWQCFLPAPVLCTEAKGRHKKNGSRCLLKDAIEELLQLLSEISFQIEGTA